MRVKDIVLGLKANPEALNTKTREEKLELLRIYYLRITNEFNQKYQRKGHLNYRDKEIYYLIRKNVYRIASEIAEAPEDKRRFRKKADAVSRLWKLLYQGTRGESKFLDI